VTRAAKKVPLLSANESPAVEGEETFALDEERTAELHRRLAEVDRGEVGLVPAAQLVGHLRRLRARR
jgi:hypothetical protein